MDSLVFKIIKLIKEENGDSISSFLNTIDRTYRMSDELRSKVDEFIRKSDCEKIEFAKFKMPAMGIALHNGVLINQVVLNQGLENLLYIVFHEIAHQYQFKKYGKDKMYECYIGEISDDEAADFMRKTEIVADDFAARKIRELQKLGLINSSFVPLQPYKTLPLNQIKAMVVNYRRMLKQNNVNSPEKISEFFYNIVKDSL